MWDFVGLVTLAVRQGCTTLKTQPVGVDGQQTSSHFGTQTHPNP